MAMLRLIQVWLILGSMMFLSSCGNPSMQSERTTVAPLDAQSQNANSMSDNEEVIEKLVITPASLSLRAGESQEFLATAIYTAKKTADVTENVSWSVSDAKVGGIDAKGKFNATSDGMVLVSAETATGVKASVAVNITKDITLSKIVLSYSATMSLNTDQSIGVTAVYSDGSHRDVATQAVFKPRSAAKLESRSGGLIRALAAGTELVDVEFSGLKATATIVVVPGTIVSVSLSPASKSLPVGAEASFELWGTFDQGGLSVNLTSQTQWSSSVPTVAFLASNANNKVVIRGLSAGTSELKATYKGLTASAAITVTAPAVVSLAILPSTPDLKVGESIAMRAYATYADAKVEEVTSSVTWASSATGVASFSPLTSGLLLAAGEGNATLTASLGDKSASASVVVTPTAPTCVAFTAASSSVFTGETLRLSVTPGGVTNQVEIEGTSVHSAPYYRDIPMNTAGSFVFHASVKGPGGQSDCSPVSVTVNARPTVTASPAPTCTLSADKAVYAAGETITLTVSGTNIARARIDGNLDVTVPPFQVKPIVSGSSPRTYTAAAYNSANIATICNSVSVTIVEPPTCTLTAERSTYSYGESVALTVTGANIASATINGQTDSSAPFKVNAIAPSVTGSKVYSASVVNSLGVSVACNNVSVVVTPPLATCVLSADKQAYSLGETITLTVSGSNISRARIDGVEVTAPPFQIKSTASGQQGSRTYTATAYNSINVATACSSVSVGIVDPPTCTLSADKSSYVYGESVVLLVTGENITSATINGQTDSSAPYQITTAAPSVSGSKVYNASASNRLGSTVACNSISVTINPAPPTCTLTANKSVYALNESMTLTANGSNIAKVRIEGEDITNAPFQRTMPINATQDGPQTFTATAYNSSGVSVACTNAVVTLAYPPTCALNAHKDKYEYGEMVSLTVTGSNFDSAVIEGVAANNNYLRNVFATSLTGSQTFTASAKSRAGVSATCASVVVPVLPPPTCSLTTDRQTYRLGEVINFTLTGTNIEKGYLNSVAFTGPSTQASLQIPLTHGVGPKTYYATVYNGKLQAHCNASVTIEAGFSCALTTDKSSYVFGEPVEVTAAGSNMVTAWFANKAVVAPFKYRTIAPSVVGPVTYNTTATNSAGVTVECTPVTVPVTMPAGYKTPGVAKEVFAFDFDYNRSFAYSYLLGDQIHILTDSRKLFKDTGTVNLNRLSIDGTQAPLKALNNGDNWLKPHCIFTYANCKFYGDTFYMPFDTYSYTLNPDANRHSYAMQKFNSQGVSLWTTPIDSYIYETSPLRKDFHAQDQTPGSVMTIFRHSYGGTPVGSIGVLRDTLLKGFEFITLDDASGAITRRTNFDAEKGFNAFYSEESDVFSQASANGRDLLFFGKFFDTRKGVYEYWEKDLRIGRINHDASGLSWTGKYSRLPSEFQRAGVVFVNNAWYIAGSDHTGARLYRLPKDTEVLSEVSIEKIPGEFFTATNLFAKGDKIYISHYGRPIDSNDYSNFYYTVFDTKTNQSKSKKVGTGRISDGITTFTSGGPDEVAMAFRTWSGPTVVRIKNDGEMIGFPVKLMDQYTRGDLRCFWISGTYGCTIADNVNQAGKVYFVTLK